jgi:hypothetical protein
MIHGFKPTFTAHGHIQSELGDSCFPTDYIRGRCTAVALRKDCRKIMVSDNADQVYQLLSAGFRTGFLLHCFQYMQVEGIGEIAEAIMESDDIPCREGGQPIISVVF